MDDEELIRTLAQKILVNLDHEVELAQNGEEAITKYKQAINRGLPFDAVILDLSIRKGLGGKDTMRQLISINPDIKGIISSGSSGDPVLTYFKEYGFCASIPKPYSLSDFRNTLNEILLL